MPKLWSETIEAHRRDVRDAVLETTAELVTERGLLSVTMSQIAERTGIGRATLYKYFPDVEAILVAWHERTTSAHLRHLSDVRDRTAGPRGRLHAVLEAYALIDHEYHGSHAHRRHLRDPVLSAFFHGGGHVQRARRELASLLEGLIKDAAKAGVVRDDVVPAELASYCLHALSGASTLSSRAGVRRLVDITLAGLDPR